MKWSSYGMSRGDCAELPLTPAGWSVGNCGGSDMPQYSAVLQSVYAISHIQCKATSTNSFAEGG